MKVVISIAAGIATVGLIYATTAFVAWDFNPGNWSDDMRFFCALAALMFGALAAFVGLVE